jgi:hypothetical protein
MKKIFLLIVVPVLLVTLGFAQTPAPSSATDQPSVKGCLAGTDGSYTVAEDGTTQIYKVTSSTVDLKPQVGHDVEVIGAKANVTSSGPSDNSVSVTAVNMISDHCATPTASASPATASTPASADTTPATPSPATTSAPVADTTTVATASAPVAADPTPAATVSTPVVADPPPAAASAAVAAVPAPTPTASEPAQATKVADNVDQLPNTATSLPLLALLGLGALGLGLLSLRSRTS